MLRRTPFASQGFSVMGEDVGSCYNNEWIISPEVQRIIELNTPMRLRGSADGVSPGRLEFSTPIDNLLVDEAASRLADLGLDEFGGEEVVNIEDRDEQDPECT
jgi:hypothetical protein